MMSCRPLRQVVEAFGQTYAVLDRTLCTPKQLLVAHDAYRVQLSACTEPPKTSIRQLSALWSLAGFCIISRPPAAARLALEYLQWLRFGLIDGDELAEVADTLLQNPIGRDNVQLYLCTALRLIATRQLERACLLLRHGVMEGGASEFSFDERAGLQAILNRLLDAPSVALILEDPLVLTEWLAENREELAALNGGRLASLAELLRGRIRHEQLGLQEAVAAELAFSHWPTTEEELGDLLSRLAASFAPTTGPFEQICLAVLKGTPGSLMALRASPPKRGEALSLQLFTFHIVDLLWRAGLIPDDIHRQELCAYVKALASSHPEGGSGHTAATAIAVDEDQHHEHHRLLHTLLVYTDGLDREEVPSIVTEILATHPLEALLQLNEQVSWARPSKRLIQSQLQARAFESWKRDDCDRDPVPALRMARAAQDRILEAAIVQAVLQSYAEGSDAPSLMDRVAEATAGSHYQQLISHAKGMMEEQDGGEGEQAIGSIQFLVGSGALLPAPVAEAILERLQSLPPASLKRVHPLTLLEFLERHQRRWVLDASLVRAVRLLLVQDRFGPW